MSEDLRIPTDGLIKGFDQHLSNDNNLRILFSIKFGTVKTIFLKKYFEANKDKYEVFHLFPINYQISANEQIFDYLKLDILVELCNRNSKLFKDNDDKTKLRFGDLKENFINLFQLDLTKDVMGAIPHGSMLLQLGKMGEKIHKFVKSIKDQQSNSSIDEVEKFYGKMQETDIVSEFINQKATELKGEKKSVLILDDLDRVDPEHIFRLLNIFSAQFDIDKSKNKFGFDKVIVVADYDNLKSIFHHKYGEETDHIGYFDKFFSQGIYEFDLTSEIVKVVREIFYKILKHRK